MSPEEFVFDENRGPMYTMPLAMIMTAMAIASMVEAREVKGKTRTAKAKADMAKAMVYAWQGRLRQGR